MYCRAMSMVAAGIWAMVLSAQTAPPRFPGLPQFTVMPQAPAVRPETESDLREFMKKYWKVGKVHGIGPEAVLGIGPENTAVCSIPLLQVPPTKNVEQMPVLRPRADNIDNMPSVKLPAPPCEEDKR